MYRTIDAAFWTDPKIHGLSLEGKLLCIYLVTNPHGHVGGIYYLPDEIITLETGIRQRILDTLWDTVSGAGFARRDQKLDVVWVVRMFHYQGKGEKNERSVAKHLATLHKSSLIHDFLEFYPSVKRFISIGYAIGHPAQDQVGIQEQEQEQEQEQDIPSPNGEGSSEPSPASEPCILSFPVVGSKVVGKKRQKLPPWGLTQTLIDRLAFAFPDMDVLAQCRKALAWCETNPSKRKTPGGMPKFLYGWMERNQNGYSGQRKGDPTKSLADSWSETQAALDSISEADLDD